MWQDQMGYIVWAKMTPQLTMICSVELDIGGGADIVAVSSWLSGKWVQPKLLERIMPFDRRQVYLWRNGEENGAGPELTLFLANLSILAWNNGDTRQAMALVQQTLARPGREQAAALLLRSMGFRGDVNAYNHFHLLLAAVLPDYIPNYVIWFDSMRVYEQWASADIACQKLQLYASAPPYDSLAATCQTQLMHFQGKYAEAYANLQPILALRPQDPLVLAWAGINASMLKRYNECQSLLTQAILNEPSQDMLMGVYWNLGDCQRALSKLTEARQSYETALRYAPDEQSRDKGLRSLENMQIQEGN